jgi:spore coat protein A
MITRREFLKSSLVVSAGLLAPWPLITPHTRSIPRLDPESIAKFIDPLPIPPVLQPDTTTFPGTDYYQVAMTQFNQQLHRDFGPTMLWGYQSTFPGPTIEGRRGRPVKVRWTNNLPTAHFLPIDHAIYGAEETVPAVRTVVHLHGQKTLPDSDGYPEAWFTRNFAEKGPFFSTDTYTYPNDQPATTLWYHDHTIGIIRLNVYAGLAGFYLLRDDVEDTLNLPKGPYEIPLLIQDRLFNADGSLLYPTQTVSDKDTRVPKVWIPELFGDVVLVNGKVWPYLQVEPRKYRFRMLNGSNARFYHLTLNESDDQGLGVKGPGPVFNQIGTDGGLMPAPVQLTELLMAPAERFDVIIDFSDLEGKSLVLNNDAKAPYPDGDEVVPDTVMLFKVTKPLNGTDTSSLPSKLAPVPLLNPEPGMVHRDLYLSEMDSEDDNPIMGLLGGAHWNDPVMEKPRVGATETWNLINGTEDAHPVHLHLVQFQILGRRQFDKKLYESEGMLLNTGDFVPPDPNERPAWKDTVKALPGFVTGIIAKFDLPSGTVSARGQKYRYVWHCHILEHEDNEMMRPFDLVS